MENKIREINIAVGLGVFIALFIISVSQGAKQIQERQQKAALEKRCPHSQFVARSCILPNGTVEVLWPGQAILYEATMKK